eukprot:gene2250-3198_t
MKRRTSDATHSPFGVRHAGKCRLYERDFWAALFTLKAGPRPPDTRRQSGPARGSPEWRMARIDLTALTSWVTPAAIQHPRDLPEHLAEIAGVRRRTALRHLDQLIELQWLVRHGSGSQVRYEP